MKSKLNQLFGRYWAWLLLADGFILGNGVAGHIWPQLRVWERSLLGGCTNETIAWLSVVSFAALGVLAFLGDYRWRKKVKRMMEDRSRMAIVAILIPTFLITQLPASAQAMQVVPMTGLTAGIPQGALIKKINVPSGSTVRKNVNGSVTIINALGEETHCERLSYVGLDGKTYEVDPVIVPGKDGGPPTVEWWALVVLAALCGVAAYALIHNWPSDEPPKDTPPPPPVVTTNPWPFTVLPPADIYITSCCPWVVYGITTNVPPPKGKHWWSVSSLNGATANVTMVTEKSVTTGMVDPYINPLAFLGLESATNYIQSYHMGRFDSVGGGINVAGPWISFKLEFWRSGNFGTVFFSDDLGQILFHTTVTLTSGGFVGTRPEGFRIVVDPGDPQHFFKFP